MSAFHRGNFLSCFDDRASMLAATGAWRSEGRGHRGGDFRQKKIPTVVRGGWRGGVIHLIRSSAKGLVAVMCNIHRWSSGLSVCLPCPSVGLSVCVPVCLLSVLCFFSLHLPLPSLSVSLVLCFYPPFSVFPSFPALSLSTYFFSLSLFASFLSLLSYLTFPASHPHLFFPLSKHHAGS